MKKTITDSNELYKYVANDYCEYDQELSSLHFDVDVSMKKKDILEVYQQIQGDINGDEVCRLNNDGSEADDFIPEGEYEDIYTGNCKDFLESFNDKNIFARYCYGDRNEPLDFIF